MCAEDYKIIKKVFNIIFNILKIVGNLIEAAKIV